MFSFWRTTMLSLQFSWVSPANQSYSHHLTSTHDSLKSGFGFVLPIFWGKTFFPLLPRGGGLNTIYGRVIHLPTIHDPTFEDLVKWHALYVEELKSMFDEYKVKFGFGDRELHCFWYFLGKLEKAQEFLHFSVVFCGGKKMKQRAEEVDLGWSRLNLVPAWITCSSDCDLGRAGGESWRCHALWWWSVWCGWGCSSVGSWETSWNFHGV